MELFLGTIQTWLWGVLALAGLVGVFAVWVEDDANRSFWMTITALWALIWAGITVWAGTHAVVPLNQRAIVFDWAKQQIVGEVRSEGLTDIPIFTGGVSFWPGGPAQIEEFVFTPSTKDGLGIKLPLVLTLDFSQVDWISVFRRRAVSDWRAYKGLVQSRGLTFAGEVLKTREPLALTRERVVLATALKESLKPLFAEDGIVIRDAQIGSWDFENAEAGKAYDAAAIRVSAAEQDRQAAVIERQAAQTRAETQLLTAQQYIEAMNRLGIKSDDAKVQYVYATLVQQMIASGKPPTTLIVGSMPPGLPR